MVSRGSSLRSLIKYLEDISDEVISEVEMLFGQVLIYYVDVEGKQHCKETRKIDTTPPHA